MKNNNVEFIFVEQLFGSSVWQLVVATKAGHGASDLWQGARWGGKGECCLGHGCFRYFNI